MPSQSRHHSMLWCYDPKEIGLSARSRMPRTYIEGERA